MLVPFLATLALIFFFLTAPHPRRMYDVLSSVDELPSQRRRRRLSSWLDLLKPVNGDPRTVEMKTTIQQQQTMQQQQQTMQQHVQQPLWKTIQQYEQTTPLSQLSYPDDEYLLRNRYAPSQPTATTLTNLQVCGRKAPISPSYEMQIKQKYSSDCPILNDPPEQTSILLLEGINTFGRTGNNLIEFLHALQFAKDGNADGVAIMNGSWVIHLLTDFWMSIKDNDDEKWRSFVERTFCVKIVFGNEELDWYARVIRMDTKDLFMYKTTSRLKQYVEYQGYILRALWRNYNSGVGTNLRRREMRDMCSVLNSMFGNEKPSAVYSVIHGRSLEGEPGYELLGRIAENSGCDPAAAIDLEPEYVKGILKPLGMMNQPIIFITDNQRPEILERLKSDPEIGPLIHLIPEDASWVGGDITVAIMSNLFIGNPASTFSGFIAKSRVALGYTTNYLFRRRNEDGQWIDVCDATCVFDKKILNTMA